MTAYSLQAQPNFMNQLFMPVARDLDTALRHDLITSATAERTQMIEWRSHQVGMPLRFVGVAQPLAEPLVVHGAHSDWVAMGAADDPNFQSNAGYPMPPEIIEQLEFLVDQELDVFDDLAIVHELPQRAHLAGTVNVEATRSKFSPEMVERSRRLGARSGTILRLAALPLIGAAIAGLGAVALAAAPVLAVAAVVDPAVCGLIQDPRTGNEVWVYITKWDTYA